MYACITRLFGRTIMQLRDGVRGWRIWKKNKSVSFELSKKNAKNQIPDVTFHYKEFQEPLVAVID